MKFNEILNEIKISKFLFIRKFMWNLDFALACIWELSFIWNFILQIVWPVNFLWNRNSIISLKFKISYGKFSFSYSRDHVDTTFAHLWRRVYVPYLALAFPMLLHVLDDFVQVLRGVLWHFLVSGSDEVGSGVAS